MRVKILLAAIVTLFASSFAMGEELIGNEWVVITNRAVRFDITSPTNVFTVAFDVDVPGRAGTFFGFNLYTDGISPQNVWVARNSEGKLSSGYGDKTVLSDGVGVSEGTHHFVIGYDCHTLLEPKSIRGINIYLDGTNVYHSTLYSWSSYNAYFISVGGRIIVNEGNYESSNAMRMVKVRNLRFWYGHRVGTLISVY